ncbi:MAG: BatA and WFA domain-containing protein [Phycisphaerales bacterium]|nr:BatA and WFA domain-containing protein [Phycisphaerales bacterium]
MTWLTPGLAGVAAAIAVPTLLILYFLKLRRRDVEISTTLLWKKAIEDLQANAPFQKLRKNLLLFLQLLVLAAALTAVAGPRTQGESLSGNRHLLVIDASASMNSTDAAGEGNSVISRLDAAKQQAINLVRNLRQSGAFDREGGDRAMVIAFDKGARVVQPFTSDKAELIRAIESIRPTDAPTSVEEAYRLVSAQAKRVMMTEERNGQVQSYERPPEPVGTIHLFSDGRLSDPETFTPGPEDGFEYHAVGRTDALNVGITTLRAGRAFDDPTKLSIFVGLESTDPTPRSVDVQLALGQDAAGIRTVEMPGATGTAVPAPPPAAGGGAPPAPPAPLPPRTPSTGGVVFSLDRPEGGIVSVRLSPSGADALATDDVAWLVVPPAKKLAVAIVTRGNLFLSEALSGLPLAKLDTYTPEAFAPALAAGRTAEYDVIVLDGWLPDPQADAPLPPGRYLILGAIPQGVGITAGQETRGARAIDWERDHPVMRGLALDDLFISRSRKLTLDKDGGARTLLTSDQGPEIVEVATDKARAIITAFDTAETNWPLNASFVVFLGSAVKYLGEDPTAAGVGRLVQPGDVLSDRLPPGAADARVRGPGVDAAVLPGPDGRVVFGPVREAGLYQLSWRGEPGPTDAVQGGRAVRPFAANLLSPAESDIQVLSTLAIGSRNAAAQRGSATKVTRELWPWLLLAAVALVLFEWFIYNRKVQL